jgi:UTP-glucose-1-phosphate uridylyltransferase
MLPLTKSQPKEMLPIGSKPCIQYIVEELAVCGVEEILIITGPKKRVIEDHFDKKMRSTKFCIAVNSRNCFRPSPMKI